jgi:hypothetical protein
MSIYPSPKLRDGVLNTVFNSADYIKDTGGGGLTISQTDALYLKNSGVVVSSANTTFNGTVNVASLLTVDDIKINTLATVNNLTSTGSISGNVSGANITSSTLGSFKDITVSGLLSGDVSGANISVSALATVKDLTVKGSLKATQTSDTLTAEFWRTDQVYSYTNGMVYSSISDATVVNSISFINIPTTVNQSFIFTFILQPSVANNPYYIKSSSKTINVNGVSIPLYGLNNINLPGAYTYLIQQITIIYNIYASSPRYISLTSVSGY